MSDQENDLSKIYVMLIDLLFAVVLGQSFLIVTREDMLLSWVNDVVGSFPTIMNVLLVYTLIITSWVGYHISVRKLPILSVWRFIIDIILLFLYFLSFNYVRNILSISFIFFLVFLCYSLWNLVRYFIEYKDNRNKWGLGKRMLQAVVFTLVFLGIFLVFYYIKSDYISSMGSFMILLSLILYRLIFKGGPKKI